MFRTRRRRSSNRSCSPPVGRAVGTVTRSGGCARHVGYSDLLFARVNWMRPAHLFRRAGVRRQRSRTCAPAREPERYRERRVLGNVFRCPAGRGLPARCRQSGRRLSFLTRSNAIQATTAQPNRRLGGRAEPSRQYPLARLPRQVDLMMSPARNLVSDSGQVSSPVENDRHRSRCRFPDWYRRHKALSIWRDIISIWRNTACPDLRGWHREQGPGRFKVQSTWNRLHGYRHYSTVCCEIEHLVAILSPPHPISAIDRYG